MTPLYLPDTGYLEERIAHTIILLGRGRVSLFGEHLQGPIPLKTALPTNGRPSGKQEKYATISQLGEQIFSCSRVDETWLLQGSSHDIEQPVILFIAPSWPLRFRLFLFYQYQAYLGWPLR